VQGAQPQRGVFSAEKQLKKGVELGGGEGV
jgi:hypothetical protein